jgi:hypothetical protein
MVNPADEYEHAVHQANTDKDFVSRMRDKITDAWEQVRDREKWDTIEAAFGSGYYLEWDVATLVRLKLINHSEGERLKQIRGY